MSSSTSSPRRQHCPTSFDSLVILWDTAPENSIILLNAALAFLGGGVFALILPTEAEDLASPWNHISSFLGWTYFIAWSASLYPAPLMTWMRGTADGLSVETRLITLIGYVCYATYNAMLLYSPKTRDEYLAERGNLPEVKTNDLLYASHGALLSVIVLFEMAYYTRREKTNTGSKNVSRSSLILLSCLLVSVLIIGALAAKGSVSLLEFAGLLANIELVANTVKYLPQLFLNYQLKGTRGIHTTTLRFQGALLSVAQMFVDSLAARPVDWSGVSGDPVKFALGFSSVFFDCIFFFQHYYLYPNSTADNDDTLNDEGAVVLLPDFNDRLPLLSIKKKVSYGNLLTV
jgi:cystinosin